MKFEYFNGKEPASNCFIVLPKALQHDPELKKLSSNAKVLYGIMLDRMKLSAINNQIDKDGKTFIYFSIESIQEELNVGRNTAFKVLEELDTDNGIGLIERVKCGQGRQSRIYVMRIVEAKYDYSADEYENEDTVPVQKFINRGFRRKNGSFRIPKCKLQEVYKWDF
ncbi:replication initiator protein A [Butyrivibrio sp. AE3004]|uniref:replication initiator protein A n=1 Tax=Butyrivibrio sp. AE3004 TaxID=1506994 RepID=UPI00068CD4D7|nr:replication initiator protein A [Butyrivibrio sp. AE3004]